MIRAALVALAAALPWAASGAEIEEVAAEDAPLALFQDPRPAAPEGLPDGLMAQSEGDIAAAWYVDPTRRYAHAVLGDAVEAGGLKVRTAEGAVLELTLPERHVFEDRYPRLADLDADGRMEVVTIRSSRRGGGAVAVYGLRGGALVELAATPDIGLANRWLNIAGIAPFLGGRELQIAYVQTPHIGGTLRVWAFDGTRLTEAASLFGFSNHEIGSPELRLSALADFDGDGRVDLAVPSADRGVLRLVAVDPGGVRVIEDIDLPGRVGTAIIERDGALYLGLKRGAVLRVTP